MSLLTLPLVDLSNNHLTYVKIFKTWGNLYINQQSYYVPINMDSYTKLNFISINFICSLNLTPYWKCQHKY